jgi:ribonuclease HI
MRRTISNDGGSGSLKIRRAAPRRDQPLADDLLDGWLEAQGLEDGFGRPVKNKEIWVQLAAAASDHEQVRWHWVKGHIGHALNERADVLAVAATRNAARSGR